MCTYGRVPRCWIDGRHDLKLDWANCTNVRDLGNLRAEGRLITRGEALVRADNLDQLTAVGRSMVEELGPSLILDVRASWEAEKFVNPYSASTFYRNVPVGVDTEAEATSVLDDYTVIVDQGHDRVAAAVAAIAEAPSGPVIVHCHAGRDRTGIVVAIMLTAVGVSRQDVLDDYAASALTDRDDLDQLMDHVDRAHGGAARYLLAGGLSSQGLSALRRRLLTSPSIR